jgi:hypothetical protein
MILGGGGFGAVSQQAVNLDYFTPGDLLAVMQHLDVQIRELEKAILADPNTSSAFYNGYAAFLADWRTWYDDHTGWLTGWFSRISNTTRDVLVGYVGQFNGWLKDYTAIGGKVSASVGAIDTDKPENSILNPLKGWGESTGKAAIGAAAVVAVAVGALYLWQHRRSLIG